MDREFLFLVLFPFTLTLISATPIYEMTTHDDNARVKTDILIDDVNDNEITKPAGKDKGVAMTSPSSMTADGQETSVTSTETFDASVSPTTGILLTEGKTTNLTTQESTESTSQENPDGMIRVENRYEPGGSQEMTSTLPVMTLIEDVTECGGTEEDHETDHPLSTVKGTDSTMLEETSPELPNEQTVYVTMVTTQSGITQETGNVAMKANMVTTESPVTAEQEETDATLMQTDASLTQTDASLTQTDASLTQTDASLTQTDATLTHTDTSLTQTDASLTQTDEYGGQIETTVPVVLLQRQAATNLVFEDDASKTQQVLGDETIEEEVNTIDEEYTTSSYLVAESDGDLIPNELGTGNEHLADILNDDQTFLISDEENATEPTLMQVKTTHATQAETEQEAAAETVLAVDILGDEETTITEEEETMITSQELHEIIPDELMPTMPLATMDVRNTPELQPNEEHLWDLMNGDAVVDKYDEPGTVETLADEVNDMETQPDAWIEEDENLGEEDGLQFDDVMEDNEINDDGQQILQDVLAGIESDQFHSGEAVVSGIGAEVDLPQVAVEGIPDNALNGNSGENDLENEAIGAAREAQLFVSDATTAIKDAIKAAQEGDTNALQEAVHRAKGAAAAADRYAAIAAVNAAASGKGQDSDVKRIAEQVQASAKAVVEAVDKLAVNVESV